MYCPKCGANLSEGAAFCESCGAQITPMGPSGGAAASPGRSPAKKNVKKYLILAGVLLVIVIGVIVWRSRNADWAGTVNRAKSAVEYQWQSLYAEGRVGNGSSDRHLEIRDTRVITIAPNDIKFWDGITCVVEFSLYSNYFGSAPYYSNAMSYDSVVFYADGSCEVRSANPFRQYSARTYSYDYSGIISGIYELGTQYNQTFSF